jgi:hypothetical protein
MRTARPQQFSRTTQFLGAGVAAGFGAFFKKRVNQNKTKD